jgi:hypothetical protein
MSPPLGRRRIDLPSAMVKQIEAPKFVANTLCRRVIEA